MSFEPRKYARYEMKAPVTIDIPGTRIRSAFCHNISCGGMYVVCEPQLEQNAKGTVTLRAAVNGIPFNVQADFRVVHKDFCIETPDKSQGIGIEFINPQEHLHQQISRMTSLIEAG